MFFRQLYSGFAESGAGPKLGLVFALLPVGAMALGYALLGTMQVDYGLNENQLSTLAIAISVTTAGGCILGGLLGSRYGVKRVVYTAYAAMTVPTLFLAYQLSTVGLTDIPLVMFYTTILAHSLLFGMAFAVHIARILVWIIKSSEVIYAELSSSYDMPARDNIGG